VEAKKIGQEALLRVSRHGDGLYLFIPGDIIDVYDITSGDRIKVKLMTRFRLIKEAKSKGEAVQPVLIKRKSK